LRPFYKDPTVNAVSSTNIAIRCQVVQKNTSFEQNADLPNGKAGATYINTRFFNPLKACG
jgi:hypothetical protein